MRVNENSSIINLLGFLFQNISKKNKRFTIFVAIIALLSALLETLSVALVIPFLENFLENKIYNQSDISVSIFNQNIGNSLSVSPFFLIFTVILASSTRILFYYYSEKTTAYIGSELSLKVFNAIFASPYYVLASSESQKIISGLIVQIENVSRAIQSAAKIFSSMLRRQYHC